MRVPILTNPEDKCIEVNLFQHFSERVMGIQDVDRCRTLDRCIELENYTYLFRHFSERVMGICESRDLDKYIEVYLFWHFFERVMGICESTNGSTKSVRV